MPLDIPSHLNLEDKTWIYQTLLGKKNPRFAFKRGQSLEVILNSISNADPSKKQALVECLKINPRWLNRDKEFGLSLIEAIKDEAYKKLLMESYKIADIVNEVSPARAQEFMKAIGSSETLVTFGVKTFPLSAMKKMFADKDFDINSPNRDGRSPFELFVEKWANFSDYNSEEEYLNLMELLLSRDDLSVSKQIWATISSQKDKSGQTLLTLAAKRSRIKIINALLNKEGFDPNIPNRQQLTALDVAFIYHDKEVIKALGQSPNLVINLNVKGLKRKESRFLSLLKLIQLPKKEKEKLFIHAALRGSIKIVEALCQDPDISTKTKHYALAFAHISRESSFIPSYQGSKQTVRFLAKHLNISNGRSIIFNEIFREGIDFSMEDGHGRNLFTYACKRGDVDFIKKVLQNPSNQVPEYALKAKIGFRSGSILTHAIYENDLELFYNLLRQQKLDVNEMITMYHHDQIYNLTPIALAVFFGRREMFSALLNCEKTNLNLDISTAGVHYSLFHFAAIHDVECAERILDKPSYDVNHKGKAGQPDLIKFIQQGDDRLTHMLLKRDSIDLNATDNLGLPALFHAISKRNAKVYNYLIDKVDLNKEFETNNGVFKAIHAVITSNNEEFLEKILQKPNGLSQEALEDALIHAARRGRSKIFEKLLNKYSFSPKVQLNALFQAAAYGATDVFKCISEDLIAVKNLNAMGVLHKLAEHPYKQQIEVNKKWAGSSALTIAASNDRTEVVSLLLTEFKEEIDVNIQGRAGMTALMYSIQNGNKKMAQSLLDHPKLDFNVANAHHLSAFGLAANYVESSGDHTFVEMIAERLLDSELVFSKTHLTTFIKTLPDPHPDSDEHKLLAIWDEAQQKGLLIQHERAELCKMRKGIERILTAIQKRSDATGVPEGKSKKEQYYQTLRALLRHLHYHYMENGITEKNTHYLYILGIAGENCGERWMQDAEICAKGVLGEVATKNLTDSEKVLLWSQQERIYQYEKFTRHLGASTNVHSLSGWLMHLGESLGIPGAKEKKQRGDIYAYEPRLKIEYAEKVFFNSYYTPQKLIELAQQDKELRKSLYAVLTDALISSKKALDTIQAAFLRDEYIEWDEDCISIESINEEAIKLVFNHLKIFEEKA